MKKPISDISLLDPSKIQYIDAIKERINSAIVNKEKIIVYGDYDCDGICGTSIVKRTFDILGYPVSYYIPSRYQDGYGLTVENVKKIAARGYSLIITVDNGVSANEAIDVANENGIDVIVIDHHEVPDTLPNAIGFIHPTVSKISNIYGSGGYMALFFSRAMLNYYDDYLVTLAGLTIVSDMMENKGYNRDVLRLSLDNFRKHNYKTLRLLLDAKSSPIISEKTYGMDLAPKINAVGRLCESPVDTCRLVKYLTSTDDSELYALANWILSKNEERKAISANFTLSPTVTKEGAIVEICDIKEGLLGIVANNMLSRYNLPSIALTVDYHDEDILRGSVRAKEGFSITEAFLDPNVTQYLITGGGHAYAGGLSIKKSDFEPFKASFINYAKSHPITKVNKPSIEISLNDVNRTNYNILRTLSPFGVGFEEPEFLVKHFKTNQLSYVSENKHISTRLGMNSKLLGFSMPKEEVEKYPFVDFRGHLYLSAFRGVESVELRLTSYEESK